MSKTTLVLSSFASGLLVGSLVFGSHIVTVAHSSSPVPQVKGLIVSGLIPTIPGLGPRIESLNLDATGQDLDGLNCGECVFNNAALTYSGGAFRMDKASFSGTTRLTLKGAAANGVAMVPLMIALARGQKPAPPRSNVPIIKTAITKETITNVAWQSPY
jgi:hypothetical protein